MFRTFFIKNYFCAISKLSFSCHKVKLGTRIIPRFLTEILASSRSYSFLVMSSGIKNAEKEKKSSKKLFSNESKDNKKITRSVTNEAEKNWKEYYLKLTLEDKRKLYSCGKKYVVLDDVESWSSSASKIRKKVRPLFDVNEELNMKISMWRGDITCLEIDVICNAANGSLLGGGGVDGAIHRAAGKKLYEECVKLNGCDTGSAKLTGGYKLPAKYILHTVGPIGEKPGLLASCYKTCLDLAKENNLRTIAVPCISTGIYGYDVEKATPVVMETVRNWLLSKDNSQSIDKIIFCVFLKKDVDVYEENLLKYFPVEKFIDIPEEETAKTEDSTTKNENKEQKELPERKKPKIEDSPKSENKEQKELLEKKKTKTEDSTKSKKKEQKELLEKKKAKTEDSTESESKEQKELVEEKKAKTDGSTKSDDKEQKELPERKKPKIEDSAKGESKKKKELSEKMKVKTEDSVKSEREEAKEQKENKKEEQPVKEAAKTKSDIEKIEKKRNKSKNDSVKDIVQESNL